MLLTFMDIIPVHGSTVTTIYYQFDYGCKFSKNLTILERKLVLCVMQIVFLLILNQIKLNTEPLFEISN